jgi:hypothetical protein
MTRLICELVISLIQACTRMGLSRKGRLFQGAQECSEAIDRRLIGGRGLWITVPRVFLLWLEKELQNSAAHEMAESNGVAAAAILNNTGIELEREGDLTGALDHYDQAAKTDVTNVFSGAMLLFSCAGWEDHRRLSGVCGTFSRSIPMTPRRYRPRRRK